MGLDQYWFATKTPVEKVEATLRGEDHNDLIQIGYHRKFHELNDLLGELYYEIHGPESEFNCAEFEIDQDRFEQIKEMCEDTLPHLLILNAEDSYDQERYDELVNQVFPAIQTALNENRKVIYHPWW